MLSCRDSCSGGTAVFLHHGSYLRPIWVFVSTPDGQRNGATHGVLKTSRKLRR
jgi:hypothetical protein